MSNTEAGQVDEQDMGHRLVTLSTGIVHRGIEIRGEIFTVCSTRTAVRAAFDDEAFAPITCKMCGGAR